MLESRIALIGNKAEILVGSSQPGTSVQPLKSALCCLRPRSTKTPASSSVCASVFSVEQADQDGYTIPQVVSTSEQLHPATDAAVGRVTRRLEPLPARYRALEALVLKQR